MTVDTASLDIDHLRGWIGRTDDAEDVITPGLAARFAATIDPAGIAAAAVAVAPAAIHWCLAPAAVPMSGIGPDGHPQRGGFLPPVPLPRRMWAGGQLDFHDRLRVGDTVRRLSRIVDVVVKEGRTGTLCFVTVQHDLSTDRGLAIAERQDLVYRALDAAPSPAVRSAVVEAPPASWQKRYPTDPVLLFRYSALTFNGHRIHYDRRYCQEEEGYPGLVVHGPLQATWLLTLAGEVKGFPPATFSFRGVSPFFDGQDLLVSARDKDGGLALWTSDIAGRQAMVAEARW
jgi:3-methylfumaryl-CoA hydratase